MKYMDICERESGARLGYDKSCTPVLVMQQ